MSELGSPPPGAPAPPTPAPPAAAPTFPDIVQDIFPSCELHLIGGSRGAGKTAFEVWMCRTVMRGEEFLGHATHPPPWWGALVLDRSEADRLAWWKSAGIGPLPLRTLDHDPLSAKDLMDMKARTALHYVERQIDVLNPPPGGVLVIDVLNFVLGDSHLSYRSGFAMGRSLSNIAHDRQLTLFGLVHGGKQKGGQQYLRLTDRIISSTGFLGTVATCAYITTPEETTSESRGKKAGKQEIGWEPHHHRAERLTLRRTPDGLFEHSELTDIPDAPEEARVIQDGEEILTAIPDAGTTAAELRKQFLDIGVKQTFFNRLTALRDVGYVKLQKRGKQIWITRAKPTDLQES